MDRRFLILALAIDITGLTIFSVLYNDATNGASLNSIATNAKNAILALELSATLGGVATAIGLAHRSGLDYKTSGALSLASLALGIFVLLASLRLGIQNGDNLAACGGFPPGYWTNTGFNRCTAWIALQEDWVARLLLAPLATLALLFCASIVSIALRLQRLTRSHSPAEKPASRSS